MAVPRPDVFLKLRSAESRIHSSFLDGQISQGLIANSGLTGFVSLSLRSGERSSIFCSLRRKTNERVPSPASKRVGAVSNFLEASSLPLPSYFLIHPSFMTTYRSPGRSTPAKATGPL